MHTMGKTSFMAIFTIAVLLAGSISYATSIYTIPTADAKQPEFEIDCVSGCAEIHLVAIEACTDEFMEEVNGGESATDRDVEDLEKCLKQAAKDFKKCMRTCEIDYDDDDDDDDDDD